MNEEEIRLKCLEAVVGKNDSEVHDIVRNAARLYEFVQFGPKTPTDTAVMDNRKVSDDSWVFPKQYIPEEEDMDPSSMAKIRDIVAGTKGAFTAPETIDETTLAQLVVPVGFLNGRVVKEGYGDQDILIKTPRHMAETPEMTKLMELCDKGIVEKGSDVAAYAGVCVDHAGPVFLGFGPEKLDGLTDLYSDQLSKRTTVLKKAKNVPQKKKAKKKAK